MTSNRFAELFGVPERKPEVWMTQVHMDLAASIQSVTEEIVLRLTRSLGGGKRRAQPMPGGRCGTQLRRQRQGAPRRAL